MVGWTLQRRSGRCVDLDLADEDDGDEDVVDLDFADEDDDDEDGVDLDFSDEDDDALIMMQDTVRVMEMSSEVLWHES